MNGEHSRFYNQATHKRADAVVRSIMDLSLRRVFNIVCTRDVVDCPQCGEKTYQLMSRLAAHLDRDHGEVYTEEQLAAFLRPEVHEHRQLVTATFHQAVIVRFDANMAEQAAAKKWTRAKKRTRQMAAAAKAGTTAPASTHSMEEEGEEEEEVVVEEDDEEEEGVE